MDTCILFAFIWLPGPIILIAYTRWPGFLSTWTPDWTPQDQAWWHELRVVRQRPGAPTPTFVLKDVVETPCWPIYTLALLAIAITTFQARHDLLRLKKTIFRILIAVLLVLRCLGTFSGTLHFHENAFFNLFPTNASSAFKGILLHLVCGSDMWSRTFLGYYDTVDQALWSETRKKPLESERVALNIPWRDNFVRLAYYHVVDGVLHVMSLRYFWAFDGGRAYTEYVNNEEVVTVGFVVLVGVWTWVQCRMRGVKDMGKGLEGVEKLEEGNQHGSWT